MKRSPRQQLRTLQREIDQLAGEYFRSGSRAEERRLLQAIHQKQAALKKAKEAI